MTFKVKESVHFAEKKIQTLIKMKRNRKGKIPHTFTETNLVLQLIYETQIKNKTDKLELAKEKREFLVLFFCSNEFF